MRTEAKFVASFPFQSSKILIEATFLSVPDYVDTLHGHTFLTVLKPSESVFHFALSYRKNLCGWHVVC